MKQIKNGFCDYYYLAKDGTVYNDRLKEYRKADKNNRVSLMMTNGNRKKISIKVLYYMVYKKPYCKDKIQDLEDEIWEQIEDTDGMYFVSNKGRVKSYKGYDAVILKPSKTKAGYQRLDIMYSGIRVSKLVHRLVANHFLERPLNNDMQLHHKDFNKENNCCSNLEWLTPIEHKQKHIEREKRNEKL